MNEADLGCVCVGGSHALPWLKDVEVCVATIDPKAVEWVKLTHPSRYHQAMQTGCPVYPAVASATPQTFRLNPISLSAQAC